MKRGGVRQGKLHWVLRSGNVWKMAVTLLLLITLVTYELKETFLDCVGKNCYEFREAQNYSKLIVWNNPLARRNFERFLDPDVGYMGTPSTVPTTPPTTALTCNFTDPSCSEAKSCTCDKDILYLVKACKRFENRAQVLYRSWGNRVKNIVFSTDGVLGGIPERSQRVQPFSDASAVQFMKSMAVEYFHAASCAVSLLNLGKLMAEEQFYEIKWLIVVDDDTFVLRDVVPKYLATLDHMISYYIVLSNAERLDWWPTGDVRSPFMTVGATAPGIVFSGGLLDHYRQNHTTLFPRDSVYAQCRRARMSDDVALGLMARVNYKIPLTARPDLRGFHWHAERPPGNVTPLTIHTEQQFQPGFVDKMITLSNKYYG